MSKEFFDMSKGMMRAFGQDLHEYTGDPATTFQRDLQLFAYGRFMILNALVQGESDNKEAFTIEDLAYNLGSSMASLLHEVYELSQEESLQGISNIKLTRTIDDLNNSFVKRFDEGFQAKVKLLDVKPTDNQTIQ